MPTFSVDGVNLRYNDEFANGLTHDEVIFVLLHEVLHLVLLHHCRMGNRDHKIFNMAADYAINPQLVAAGFKAPKGVLLDKKFSNLNAEDIYKILYEENEKKKKDGKSDGDKQESESGGKPSGNPSDKQGNKSSGQPSDKPGDTPSFGEFSPAQDIKLSEETIKIQVTQAINLAKAAGQLPGGDLIKIIEEAQKPQYDWASILQRFISEITAKDYSFSHANARHISRGIILPTLFSKSVGKIIIVADTSGSMGSDLKLIANEIAACFESLSEDNQKARMTILYADTMVAGVQEFEAGDDIKLQFAGGGGTLFRPAFDYIDKHYSEEKIECVFYITDGYCGDLAQLNGLSPEFPVFWALTVSNDGFEPSFGESFKFTLV